MKEKIWILLCVVMFSVVAGLWVRRAVIVEGVGSSNEMTQPGAAVSNNHSKNISSVEQVLDDLDAILIPILNQVNQQNQMIKVKVEKEPKTSYTSPDITLTMDHPDDVMPTMHITLPQGIDGVKGPNGPRGSPGPDGPDGPRGPPGGL